MSATATPVTPDLAVAYGRQFASFYDRLFPGGAAAEPAVARLAALRLREGRRALELGVGTGRIALPLAERSGPVVGVDGSPDMLAPLRAAPGDVACVEADIRGFCAGEEQFDLVFCVCGTLSMVLEREGQQAVLDACAGAAAPGAAVVIETHDPDGVVAMHDGRPRETFFSPYPGPDTGLLSHSSLDLAARVWQLSHVWFEGGRARVATEVSRLTSPAEVDEYATAAGLEPEACWDGWSGAPRTGRAPTFVSVYRRS